MMMKRRLGRSGLTISALGLGGWALGGRMASGEQQLGYANVDENEAVGALRRGIELGATLIDTADAYGAGRSERLLAPVLAEHPEVLIATKFGNTIDEDARQLTGTDVSPDYIRHAADASLQRLGRERIDLYQLHSPDITPAQAADVAGALEGLVDAGKIAWFGVSTDSPELAAPYLDSPHFTAVQIELNVLDDNPAMIAFCDDNDLAGLCRSPLAMGLLGGRYDAATRIGADDIRGKQPEWMRWFVDGRPAPDYLERLEAVRGELTADGRTLAQGALGWIFARSQRVIPIPGFRNDAQVEDNLGALEFGPLDPARFAAVERLLERA
jgi:aryl-alcohol dehydrogenase-like predicted oxidoreductase